MSKIQTLHKAMQALNAAHKEAKGTIFEIIEELIKENSALVEHVNKLEMKVKQLEARSGTALTLPVPKDEERSATLTVEVDYEKQEVKKVEEERMPLAEAVVSTELIRDFSPTPEKLQLQQDVMARLAEVLGITIKENATMIDRYPVLLVAKDSTGSMGQWETYMAQCVAHWTKAMLHLHYGRSVDARYITFDAEGVRKANFEKCFGESEGVGALVSPAISGLNSMTDEYAYEDYHDVYVLILSDGDNHSEDNADMVRQLKRLAPKTEQLWYVEMNQYNRMSPILSALKPNKTDKLPENMSAHIIQSKSKVYVELFEMFKPVVEKEENNG
ncbi:putative sporulation protein YhbH [Bacillus phage BCP78]|uniref:Putative sporulation protein YhbH n=3 Tax=Tsarbombavirus BCP78 TaxID=1985182 RepID=J9PQX7_9CAUD|nr:sporulation protein [Bacillus phage BCP78]YP_009783399.1 putative sporulation protein YhbH [Bacillus phage BCU4]AEW47041.1 putative sporulation protein YhbH [Bacillus phage BCP78]AEW47532.1 putative sporulation protein YhbH [Bacillus phage BCU4]AQN32637.1 putative sporulation protein YhbH [Bacillus phage BCP12]